MKYAALIAFIVALLFAASSVQAISISWTNLVQNNQWNTPQNWYPPQVPGANDDVTISNGTVQATTPVAINTLSMGTQVSAPAILYIYSTFAVANGVQCEANGIIVMSSGASALVGDVTIDGTLTFSSGSVSGQVTVNGFADLSSDAAKTISSGTLQLTGKSKIGGVVVLSGTSPLLQITSTSKWEGVNIQPAPGASGALFDTTQGSVEVTATISVLANGQFGPFKLLAGQNATLFSNVSFSNTVHVHAGSWITTIGSAVVALSVSGSGGVSSSGASTTFGTQTFDGVIGCSGQSCTFAGAGSSVNNLVVSTGATTISSGGALSASILSISRGSLTVAGTLTVGQLNFLGAGSISGATIQAQNLYTNNKNPFSLNGGVAVSSAANFDGAALNFGAAGMIHLSKSSNSQISSALVLQGPPNSGGFSNNGQIAVNAPLQSTNIDVIGTGTWTLAANLAIAGAELAATTINLGSGTAVTGRNACINVATIAAGTVKAKIDKLSFTCSGSCDDVVAACSPMPADSFSFRG